MNGTIMSAIPILLFLTGAGLGCGWIGIMLVGVMWFGFLMGERKEQFDVSRQKAVRTEAGSVRA
jgi:hypothetical protein